EWALALPQKRYVFCVGKGDNTVALLVDSLPHSVDLAEQDCVTDETLDNDSVLSLLVEKHFLRGECPTTGCPERRWALSCWCWPIAVSTRTQIQICII